MTTDEQHIIDAGRGHLIDGRPQVRQPITLCKYCSTRIWPDGHGSWVDSTDGDGCDPDVHEPGVKA